MATNDLAANIDRLNRQEYDAAGDLFWQWTVYDAVHAGWWLANIGGRVVLDRAIRVARLTPMSNVLELCCGVGDGCRYLIGRTGCRATGIELNAQQVDRAHRRSQMQSTGNRGAPRIIEADALQWSADGKYDLVLLVDALMLMPDEPQILVSARRALTSDGIFLSADIVAGPRIDARARRFVWHEDGIVNLPTAVERHRRFAAAGLEIVDWVDATQLAVRCFDRVERATRRHERRLRPYKGAERYARWLRNAQVYRQMFLRGRLGYAIAQGRAASV